MKIAKGSIPFWENLYQKYQFWGLHAHIFKGTTVKFEGANLTWKCEPGTLPQAKFCKKKLLKGVYPFWVNLYQKLPILAISGVLRAHILSENGEIWREGTDLDSGQRA